MSTTARAPAQPVSPRERIARGLVMLAIDMLALAALTIAVAFAGGAAGVAFYLAFHIY